VSSTFTITNTGGGILSDITAVSTLAGPLVGPVSIDCTLSLPATLAVGESFQCTVSADPDIASFPYVDVDVEATITLTMTGTGPAGNTVTSTGTAVASFDLLFANRLEIDVVQDLTSTGFPGEAVSVFTISNTGASRLVNFNLAAGYYGAADFSACIVPASLDRGQRFTCVMHGPKPLPGRIVTHGLVVQAERLDGWATNNFANTNYFG
jgi:hypothetical protein